MLTSKAMLLVIGLPFLVSSCSTHKVTCGYVVPPPVARLCDHYKGCKGVLSRREAKAMAKGTHLGGACRYVY